MGERADGLRALAGMVGELARSAPELRLSPLASELRRPIRVATVGRRGVGRRTVAAALRRNGVLVSDSGCADVRVLVIAEDVKPEDEVTLVTGPPTLVVLNKADLAGSARGGAMANAARRAAEVAKLTGAPTVAMVGLLARNADQVVDDVLVAALRTMVTVPADLTSVDAFVAADHPVSRASRQRLLSGFDRFGIALAVVGLARGATPEALPTLLREASNVDGVLGSLRQVVAAVRYERVRRALGELNTAAVQSGDRRVADLLASDGTVLATMTAAVEVMEAHGLTVDTRDAAADHRRRALRWRRYGCGPVNTLHRTCSADIVRGSLRLLDGAQR